MTITTAPRLTADDVAALNQLVAESVSTILAADWDKWLETFDDDIVLLPPGAPTTSGKADAKAFLNKFPHITAFTSTPDDFEGRGDFAAVRGRYTMTTETEDGTQSDTGTWMFTCRHGEDGKWRAVWDTWNSDQAPA